MMNATAFVSRWTAITKSKVVHFISFHVSSIYYFEIIHRSIMSYRSSIMPAEPGWILLSYFLLVLLISVPPADSFSSFSTKHRQRNIVRTANPTFQSSTQLLLAKSGTKKKKPRDSTIAVNRRARRNYEVLETLEAGISLLGTEVKSIRDGKMNLRDAYVRTDKNGRSCTLMNCHIGKHTMSGAYFQHEERRPRPLLVHASQARKFQQQTEQKGMTIVPLKAYFNADNRIKIQIALCRGKNVRDKRADIKERDLKRETNRIVKNFRV